MKYCVIIPFFIIVAVSCSSISTNETLAQIHYSYYPNNTLKELYYFKLKNKKRIKDGDCLLFRDGKLIRHARFKMGIYDGLQEIITDNYIKHLFYHNGNLIWVKVYNSNKLVTFCNFKHNMPFNGYIWNIHYAKLAKHSLIYEFDKGRVINIFKCDKNGDIIKKIDEAPPFHL